VYKYWSLLSSLIRNFGDVQADEVGWGDGGEADVALDPPTVRQAIGWSFALRNIRRMEAEEAAEQLRRETGAESVRNVKACHFCSMQITSTGRLCRPARCARTCHICSANAAC
jgi:hypothetical protein